MGILEEITAAVSRKLGVNIRGLSIEADHEVFHAHLTVLVSDVAEVDRICAGLKEIKGVKFAKRIS